jgi:hypothetical protein
MKEEERRNNVIYFREETASEMAPGTSVSMGRTRQVKQQQRQQQRERREGAGLGMLGLILAILAFFMMPLLMGISGFIIGLVAATRGATGTGGWAMGLSAAAVLLTLFLRPFY